MYKSTVKLFKTNELKKQLFTGWDIVRYMGKIVSAVDGVFFLLKESQVISAAQHTWAAVANLVLLPISIISTAIDGYETNEKVTYMKEFRSKIKSAKHITPQLTNAKANRLCELLLTEKSKLREFKVITKECSFESRLQTILTKLQAENADARRRAEQEVNHIVKCVKNRIAEKVGVKAVKLALSIASIAISIIGLTCASAAAPLIIIGLVLGIIGIVNFIYSDFVPKDTVTQDEKPMFYSRIIKHLNSTL